MFWYLYFIAPEILLKRGGLCFLVMRLCLADNICWVGRYIVLVGYEILVAFDFPIEVSCCSLMQHSAIHVRATPHRQQKALRAAAAFLYVSAEKEQSRLFTCYSWQLRTWH